MFQNESGMSAVGRESTRNRARDVDELMLVESGRRNELCMETVLPLQSIFCFVQTTKSFVPSPHPNVGFESQSMWRQPFPEEVRRTYGLRTPIRWLAEQKKGIIGQVGRGKGQ